MNGEESKQPRADPDDYYDPVHNESLLVSLSGYSGNVFILYELPATLMPAGTPPQNGTKDFS